MRIIILTLLLCAFSLPALACRCVAPNDKLAEQSYNEADIVVNAEILNVSDGWDNTGPLVKMKINSVIKGDEIPDEITANYNDTTAACGNEFAVGEKYIIALYDTRSLLLTANNSRGYGFRVMISCHQNQVRYYINNKDKEESLK